MKTEIDQRYYTVKQLARYTGLPATTIYEWAALGTLPSFKIGKRVLFDLQDVDRAIKGNKRRTVNPQMKVNEIFRGR